MKRPAKTGPRPFTTDYGLTQGHCATKKSALRSALSRVIEDELSHVTIEDENGKVLARIRRVSFWGIFIDVGGKTHAVPGTGPRHLRRAA